MYFLMPQTIYNEYYDPTMNAFKINQANRSKIAIFKDKENLLNPQKRTNYSKGALILLHGDIKNQSFIEEFFEFGMIDIEVIDCMEIL
jgi:5-methylthioribose kinase